jgi:hypothetical protein
VPPGVWPLRCACGVTSAQASCACCWWPSRWRWRHSASVGFFCRPPARRLAARCPPAAGWRCGAQHRQPPHAEAFKAEATAAWGLQGRAVAELSDHGPCSARGPGRCAARLVALKGGGARLPACAVPCLVATAPDASIGQPTADMSGAGHCLGRSRPAGGAGRAGGPAAAAGRCQPANHAGASTTEPDRGARFS